jgi:hypothetical protein
MRVIKVTETGPDEIHLIMNRTTPDEIITFIDRDIEYNGVTYSGYLPVKYDYDFTAGHYNIYMRKQLESEKIIYPEPREEDTDNTIAARMLEFRLTSQREIDNGIEMTDVNGDPLFYPLTTADLLRLQTVIAMTNLGIATPFQARNELAPRIYPTDELNEIALKAFRHIAYHQNRVAFIGTMMARLVTTQEVLDVDYYGLTEDLEKELQEIVEAVTVDSTGSTRELVERLEAEKDELVTELSMTQEALFEVHEENSMLRSELDVTQQAVFEIYELIEGGK